MARLCPRLRAVVVPALALAQAAVAHAAADGPNPPPGFRDRSGMSELVVWQGLNGLVGGALLGYAITGGQIDKHCPDDPKAKFPEPCQDALARSSGVTALGLAAGIAAPLLVTRGKDVRTSDVLLVNRSTFVGLMHGYIVPFAAGLDNFDSGERRALSALAFTGDVMGLGVGAYLAHRHDLPPGKVSFLGTLHFATFLSALTVGESIPDKDDLSQSDRRAILGVSLGLADIALAIGIANLDRIDIGRRRVFWLDTGSILGLMAGSGMGALLGGSSRRAAAIGGALGTAAGIALTYWLTAADEEKWRLRHEPGKSALRFDPPAFRVEPDDTGGGTRVSVDAFRGRF